MRAPHEILPGGPHHAILRGWAILAVVALALSGLALLMPALSKVPGLDTAVDWPADFFQKGLVAHVALSFIVWFLAVTALIAMSALRLPDRRDSALAGGVGLVLGAGGTAAIAAAPFIGGEPSLNNYVPTIIHPVYYAGLAMVAVATLIAVVHMLARLMGPDDEARGQRMALLAMGLLYVAALVAVGIAQHQLSVPPVDYDTIERLFWGGGHLLQFVNLALLLVALDRLGRIALTDSPIGEAPLSWAAATLFLAGAAGLAIYSLTDIRGEAHLTHFTELQYAFAIPVAIAAWSAASRWRRWRMAQEPIATVSFGAGSLVFLIGCALGLFVDGGDTRTPAHYHGVIGGINIAFYGLFYTQFLPALGRAVTRQRLAIAQIIVYAVGQSLFVAGLFLAGGMGAARKSMGAGLETGDMAAVITLALRDLGLLLAVLASAAFVVVALAALMRRRETS